MNKFKELFRSAVEMVRVHPVLYGLVAAVSLLASLTMYDAMGYGDLPPFFDFFCVALTAFLYCLVTIMWQESHGEPSRWIEAGGGIAGVGIGLMILSLWEAPAPRFFGVCTACLALFLFLYAARTENNLLSVLVKDLGFSLLSAFAVVAGLLLVFLAVTEIIMDLPENEVLSCILGFGFFLVPLSMMVTLVFRKEPVISSGRGFRIFMLRVLFPLYLVLLAVLYAYLIKILVLQDMPSGLINWLVSYACAVFMFFYFVLEEFQGERLVAVFRGRGGLLLLPLLAFQGFAVGIRVSAYGLTPQRWHGLLFMGFSLVFVVVTLAKGGRYRRLLFLLLAVLLLVETLTPLNGDRVARWSQGRRAHRILQRHQVYTVFDFPAALKNMADRELDGLESALGYLSGNTEESDPLILELLPVYESLVQEERLGRGMPTDVQTRRFDYDIFRVPRHDGQEYIGQDISRYRSLEPRRYYLYCGYGEPLATSLLLPIGKLSEGKFSERKLSEGKDEYLDMTDYFLEHLVDSFEADIQDDHDQLLVYRQEGLAIVFTKVILDWKRLNDEAGFIHATIQYLVLRE